MISKSLHENRLTAVRNKIFYHLKPLIPRPIQLAVRRMLMRHTLNNSRHIWPIDNRSSRPPLNWQGWPEGKKFAFILMHDVDTAFGQSKCRQLMQIDEEMGFRSLFSFVPEGYTVSSELRENLVKRGFEVGVHGLRHDGKLFSSKAMFLQRAKRINHYLKEWKSVGFVSPSMHRNLDLIHELNIEYETSTFDTDPFEPHSEGIGSIFPFYVSGDGTGSKGYLELPYTLPQDFTLFIIMKEKTIDIWKKKLDWIAAHGGMALFISHPDYMNFGNTALNVEEYPAEYYREFLQYVKDTYQGQYWDVLPKKMSVFWKENMKKDLKSVNTGRACMLAYTYYESDNRVRRYAETLARQGYQVDAVALRKEGQRQYEDLNGVRVFRIQQRVRDEKSKFSYLYKLLLFFVHSARFISKQHRARRYDLIHVHSVPDFEVFATFFAKIRGAKIILDIHDIVPEFYASKFHVSRQSLIFKALILVEKASIAFADHAIIANHIWEKTLISRSVKKEKCTTILNYPDLSIFYRRPGARTDDKFIIIYPGSINWHQGLDIAVTAFAQIKDEMPAAEFHIYGDGPMLSAIQHLIAELGLQAKVFLKGSLPLDQIAGAMAGADLAVVPKRNDFFGGDAFSTKIFEFMALGIPVIAAATRVDRFYFNDSVVRFFEPENDKDLALSLRELIQNKEIRERLAANASSFVAEYAWDRNEKDYLSLVDKLLGQKER